MRRNAIIVLALLLCAVALAEGTGMKYDFSIFANVTLKGIDISTRNTIDKKRALRHQQGATTLKYL